MTSLRTGLIFALALLTAVLLTLACDSGIEAVKTAGRVADDVATLAIPDRSSNDDGAVAVQPAEQSLSSDAQEVITTLHQLTVAERGGRIDYDRDDLRHWVDRDRDCQNTRAEVLIAESRAEVSFAPRDDGENCRVTQGEWLGPWSGEVFADATDVDIDHHVPLGHAHESGGWQWDEDRKRAYANDLSLPASLQATKASVNRIKGKQAPDEWRPEKRAGWCRYAADWVAVKTKWELTVTWAEVTALEGMLTTCGDENSWGLAGRRE